MNTAQIMETFTINDLIEAINELKSDGSNVEYDRALSEIFEWFCPIYSDMENPIKGFD